MKQRIIISPSIAILSFFILVSCSAETFADEGCVTSKCHQSLLKDAKYIHGPVAARECTVCHTPHEPGKKSRLEKEGNDLCFTCHFDVQEEIQKKFMHPALQGGCTSCHNPHGSPFRKLLSTEGEALCFQCHPQISEKLAGPNKVHAPLKTDKGCASCHSPHAGNNEKLLPSKQEIELCLECHKNVIRSSMKVLHGPIKAGSCTPCHDPHGSPHRKLLAKEFPAEAYVPYNDKEYELCFSCHKRDLLRFPETSFATGFRDGDRNLHYLHVNKKENGRNCRLCHNPHGSENPVLIAQSVAFGQWQLPLKFTKTDTGGSCSPGCHKTFNYDRKTAGKAPEVRKQSESKEKQK